MFDLQFLRARLDAATEPSRILDGDIWWIASCDDDMRASFDRGGYVLKVMEREGSPGKGLLCFFDSSRKPPSLLDYAQQYTLSVDEALWLVNRLFPKDWPEILRNALSKLAREGDWHITSPKEGAHRGLALAIMQVAITKLCDQSSSIFPHFEVNAPMPEGVAVPRD